jgi:hypothetical protein
MSHGRSRTGLAVVAALLALVACRGDTSAPCGVKILCDQCAQAADGSFVIEPGQQVQFRLVDTCTGATVP